MSYENILVETLGEGARKTGLIRLNRPKALNALSDPLMDELGAALQAFDADPGIGCIVLTGNEKAFAAGADIPTLAQHDFMSAFQTQLISRNWEHILRIRKPVLGAVSGFCLGGGCELAMMCDVLYAADSAKFGQPEIKLGVIPGGGGTQRLPRWVGKSKAMDLLLTGRLMDAAEAERAEVLRLQSRVRQQACRRVGVGARTIDEVGAVEGGAGVGGANEQIRIRPALEGDLGGVVGRRVEEGRPAGAELVAPEVD